eukprot:SAG31_NODE_2197_length_6216_cov_4.189962_4_plen_111_part_00
MTWLALKPVKKPAIIVYGPQNALIRGKCSDQGTQAAETHGSQSCFAALDVSQCFTVRPAPFGNFVDELGRQRFLIQTGVLGCQTLLGGGDFQGVVDNLCGTDKFEYHRYR